MAESKRRPRKLKGAVLVMVVTLLFVLIVMLLATLTVVSNANRRTITKYEENQAYYTARSALEVYINEVLEDYDTINGKGNDVITGWQTIGFTFEEDEESKQMKTNLTNDTVFNGKEPISKGFLYQQEIFCYLTPKYKLADSAFDSTAPAGSGKVNFVDASEEENWVKTNTDEDKNSYIQYTAVLPTTDSTVGSKSLGKMADDSDSDGRGDVTVTVELLRVIYRDKDKNVLYDGTFKNTSAENVDLSGNIKMSAIDWNNTYYRLKVTSTTTVSDSTGAENEATVSVLLEPNTPVSKSSFTNAMTSFNSTDQFNSTSVIGGSSASNPQATYTVPGDGAMSGRSVLDYKKVFTETQALWSLFKNNYVIVRSGTIDGKNQFLVNGYGALDATGEERDSRPFIYAAGLSNTNSMRIGDTGKACDIILGANGTLAEDSTYAYMVNELTKSSIDPSNLAFITAQNGTEVYGDVYCDGDMYIRGNNIKFHGNVYCTGNIYFEVTPSSVQFDKGVHVTATSSYYGKNGGSFAKIETSVVATTVDCTITPGSLAIPKDTDAAPDDPQQYVTDMITLNDLPGRTGPVYIHSTETETTSYRDESGKPLSALEMFKNCSGKDTVSLSVSSTATDLTRDNHNITPTGTEVNGFYQYKLNMSDFANVGPGNPYYIDTQGKNIQIQLTGGIDSAEPCFIVKGSGSVVFTVADNDFVQHKGFSVYTEESYTLHEAKSGFEFGDENYYKENPDKSPKPSSPNIFCFAGKDSELFTANGDNFFFTGYMYGPEAEFNAINANGAEINYTYNGQPGKMHLQVIGSIVFNKIKVRNGFGIGFVPQGAGGGADSLMGTMITWDQQHWLGS